MLKIKIIALISLSVLILNSCKDDDPVSDKLELPQSVGNNQIVEHTAYTLSYNETHEQADWVAYELTYEEVTTDSFARTDDFREDPLVTTGSAYDSDYTGSGYDRGHLCPAGDNAWSYTAMSESFYMSNMSPQIHEFNNGKWKYLEYQVRDWAEMYQKIYVVAGPVLKSGLPTIGANKVSVPEKFYKVILDYEGKKGIGFIMPHEDIELSFKNFAVTIDEVEAETGLDFFYKLDDDTEEQIESTLNLSQWEFTYY